MIRQKTPKPYLMLWNKRLPKIRYNQKNLTSFSVISFTQKLRQTKTVAWRQLFRYQWMLDFNIKRAIIKDCPLQIQEFLPFLMNDK